MFRNYLKTAFRNLLKQKFYAGINILGLSVGIACCLMISLWVFHELSYDRFHEKSDRIVRAGADIKFGEMEMRATYMPAPFRDALIQDVPEVINAGRIRESGSRLARVQEREMDNINVDNVVFADPELFEILTWEILDGNPIEGLVEPNTVAINRSTKELFFPEGSAIGKTLIFNNEAQRKIVAVYEDLPSNSHMHFNMMVSMITTEDSKSQEWLSHNFVTYMELAEGADPQNVDAHFPDMIEKYVGPQLLQFVGSTMEEMAASGNHLFYFTQELEEVHLGSGDLMSSFEPGGEWSYVYIFSAIAFFILLIACINFMNLSTARSAGRAREVGVRKALGSHRWQLVWQFILESLLVTLLAVTIGVFLAEFILPYFNELANKDLVLPWSAWWFIPALMGLVCIVGLMAGLYPAFFLSAFRPVEVFKGAVSRGAKSGNLRSALVVFQFATSIVLIVSTVIVYRQLGYVQDKKIGFNKDQVLILENVYAMGNQNAYTFKKELSAYPEVEIASLSNFLPVRGTSRSNTAFWPEGNRSQETSVIMQYWTVDHDFVEAMGMEIVEGRDFSLDHPTDSAGVILNEEAARQLGFVNALGEVVETFGGGSAEAPEIDKFTVVGIVKNFHFESLKENISPLGLFIGGGTSNMAIRFNGENIKPLLAKTEAKWREFAPSQPFSYSFMDERFAAMYDQEQRVGNIFAAFAGLAILIACLGLFALAAFMAEQRTKEISIRKVLGANSRQIVVLLSSDFLKLVGIALVLAIPIAWYSMDQWLEDYAYRVNMDVWTFLIAGAIAMGIALLTVSSQSLRAAQTNPGEALRNE